MAPPRLAPLLGSLLLVGCMSWSPGWETPYRPSSAATDTAPGSRHGDADELFATAGDGDALAEARRAYERRLETSPEDYDTLVRLSEIYILTGAAYSPTRRAKAEAYITGIRLAEAAMATNEAFRRRVEGGANLGEAVDELGADEMKAMLLWVTGVSYYFKECLSGPGHLVNFRWMARTRETTEHMMAVDPDFEHGAVPFSLGIYYLALPPSAGGDLERSKELIDRAVAASDGHLLARWGRAKYLRVATGDREGFEEDLRWVLSRDPRDASSPFAWNVYMQRDAEEMLSRIDSIFSGQSP